MHTHIKLIVGLGNPGAEYADTRHNAGAWLVETLAAQHQLHLKREAKFKGLCATWSSADHECRLLLPTTFMNLCGQSVQALANFYHITPAEILVVHDELDLPCGVARLKHDGGHGGHNGLRDIMAHLHHKHFHRLRIGIGHPGHSAEVIHYVLHSPTRAERQRIDCAILAALDILPLLFAGEWQKAMNQLHTKPVGRENSKQTL